MSYVVKGGGQQVDVVLPRNQVDDYVFHRQIWKQPPPGTFNKPTGMTIDGSGVLYVLDSENARVQTYNKDGKFLLQWGRLGGRTGQFVDPMGLTTDRHGHVYVADTGNHRIQKFTSNGTFITSWGSFGSGAGQLNNPRGIAVHPDGHVYVADTLNHRIQKFTSDGTFLASWGTRGAGPSQFDQPRAITTDSNGSVYVADTYNHRIQKFTNSGTILAVWGSHGDAAGQFNLPHSASIDSDGNLHVADTYNHRVQKFSNTGVFLTSWGSNGAGSGQFNEPGSTAASGNGSVYVADTYNHRIQKFTNSGTFLLGWGSRGDVPGQLQSPHGVGIDSNRNVYVADTANHRIQKFTSTGTFVTSWGSFGHGPSQFNAPYAITVDRSGNVYVADYENHRIQKFTSTGTFVTSWGSLGSGHGQFSGPRALDTDHDGNIYVVENENNRIQKFTSNGTFITSWGSFGSGAGQLNNPRGIAVHPDGHVYVADTLNHRIQKFTSDGTFLASWGTRGAGPSQFRVPKGVSVDSNGNVYVADTDNQRLQKFTADGSYLLSWGEFGGVDGQFQWLDGIAVSDDGHIFIADQKNNRIQILRQMQYTQPVANIVAAAPRSVIQGQRVYLSGAGSDSDETATLDAYEWLLDNSSTPFATTVDTALDTTGLTPGIHTITFRVRDTEGQYSAPQTVTIDVSLPASQTRTWTFLLYLAADNGQIAPFLNRNSALGAIYRLEHSAPNVNVQVVALYDGDRPGGNDTFRYTIDRNGHVTQEPLGELNMGDPQTLTEFIRWGQQTAPADHYYLAIADHANALDGMAWDYTSSRTERLTNGELRQALVAATDNGARPIDVLHFDGCLMGLVENSYQVRGLASYVIASQNLAWSAFAYEHYRTGVGTRTTPAQFAETVVDRYVKRVGNYPHTIAALNMSKLDEVVRRTNTLAEELLRYALVNQSNRDTLMNLRQRVQKFDSNGSLTITNEDDYIDLGHWASLVRNTVRDSEVQAAAGALQTALGSFVDNEHHLSGDYLGVSIDLDQASGVGIYYPTTLSHKTYDVYVQGDLTFATEQLWDEYLSAKLAPLPFNDEEHAPLPVGPVPIGFNQRAFLPLTTR